MKLIENHWYKFNDREENYIGQYVGRQEGFECCVCGKGTNAYTFNIWHGKDYETWGYGERHMPTIIEDLGSSMNEYRQQVLEFLMNTNTQCIIEYAGYMFNENLRKDNKLDVYYVTLKK